MIRRTDQPHEPPPVNVQLPSIADDVRLSGARIVQPGQLPQPADVVEIASQDSFPCSDPPAYSGCHV